MWLLSLILPYRVVGRLWNKPVTKATTRWWSFCWAWGRTLTYRTRWGQDRTVVYMSNGRWYVLHLVKPRAIVTLPPGVVCILIHTLYSATNTNSQAPLQLHIFTCTSQNYSHPVKWYIVWTICHIFTPELYIVIVCLCGCYKHVWEDKNCVIELFCCVLLYLCDYWHMNTYSCIQCSEWTGTVLDTVPGGGVWVSEHPVYVYWNMCYLIWCIMSEAMSCMRLAKYEQNTSLHVLWTTPNCGLSPLLHVVVADPEGVQWVPWNPSFKGLPLKISVCTNVLHTLTLELRTLASQ